MSLILRANKGSALTYGEMDGNFTHLQTGIDTLEANKVNRSEYSTELANIIEGLGNLSLDNFTTTNLAEGTNLYYTNARARGAISVSGAPLSYNSSTGLISIDVSAYALKTYVDNAVSTLNTDVNNAITSAVSTAISGLIDGAPTTLNTLNEIAAAIGDNADFINTVNSAINNKLASSASLTLSGDVSATGVFQSDALNLSVTIVDDSHTHDTRYYTETEADNRFVNASGDTMTSNLTFTNDVTGIVWSRNTDFASIKFYNTGDGDVDSRLEFNIGDNNNEDFRFTYTPSGLASVELLRMMPDGGDTGITFRGYTMWHAGSDGPGSGLDADTLDGKHASDFVLSSGGGSTFVEPGDLSTVAYTGSYVDLTNKPTLFSGAYADLTGKPTLATVAGTGSYTDLTNKPTIPTVPTNLSSFTNDVGFITTYINNYVSSLSWDTGTGILTLNRTGLTALTIDLDGRYLTSYTDTTYTASTGLTLTGTAFSVNSDQRASIQYIGYSTTDYIQSTDTQHKYYINSTLTHLMDSSGDFHALGDVVAYSASTSDPRLKTDITKIDDPLGKLEKLNGYTFTYKHDDRKSAGVLSTEVKEVLPSAVRTKTFEIIDGQDYEVVDYNQLTGLLIESVKELTARVKELEAIINNSKLTPEGK